MVYFFMHKNNSVKKALVTLLPLAALVVIFESVVLIDELTNMGLRKRVENTLPVVVKKDQKVMPDEVNFLIKSDKSKLESKTDYVTVSVSLMSERAYSVDAINFYVTYDPLMMTIDEKSLSYGGGDLAKPTVSKVDKKGKLVINYLVSKPEGVSLEPKRELGLVNFKMMPKKSGKSEVAILVGNDKVEDNKTMVVENRSSRVIPFISNKLLIESAF